MPAWIILHERVQYSTDTSRQEYNVFYRTLRLDGATFGVRSSDLSAIQQHFAEVIEYGSDNDRSICRSDSKKVSLLVRVYYRITVCTVDLNCGTYILNCGTHTLNCGIVAHSCGILVL